MNKDNQAERELSMMPNPKKYIEVEQILHFTNSFCLKILFITWQFLNILQNGFWLNHLFTTIVIHKLAQLYLVKKALLEINDK